MDFAVAYTEDQAQFRQEVRSWLEENIPDEMKLPIDSNDFTNEMYLWWRETHKELAKKGWLYPTFSQEYGGGGLTGDHEVVIEEEFARARAPRGYSSMHVLHTLLVWSTEEQKQQFLVPFLNGDLVCWNKLTEPHSGADLADYRSRAVREGDGWIVNGSQVFVSGQPPDYMGGPLLTDPDAPRHRNLGYFMIPVPNEGLDIKEMDLLVGHGQHAIFYDNMPLPGDHLIGGDHQGWQVVGTHLEDEHGGRGRAAPRDEATDKMVEYVSETRHNGGILGSDPLVQQRTMENVLDAHVQRLLLQRTYWMYQSRMEIQYEGNVANVHGRESSLRIEKRIRDVYGLSSLLNTREPDAPHGGRQEINARGKAGQNHAGGSTNIAKVILARRIGISRTQERAAPTPSTATSHGS